MKKVYIVAAKRTAIGRFHGGLSPLSAADLGSKVVADILKTTPIDPAKIDEVIVGNVLMAGQKQGIARQAAILGGIPFTVPAYGVNMICGSGMKSIMNGWLTIASGMQNIVMAGGTESMSNSGFILPGVIRRGNKMGNMVALDHAVCDGLTDAFEDYHMGITAENIAEKYAISRQEQDEFAMASQNKANKALEKGVFDREIIHLEVKDRAGIYSIDVDEFPNKLTSFEKLSKLKPAFKKDGTVTAGNSSGINDGASFVMLASEQAVKEYDLTILAEIIAVGQAGVAPSFMGMGPVGAIQNALNYANLNLSDIEVLELNEAFAAQSIGVITELGKVQDLTKAEILNRTNKNGGAIALGHPIGASGNRIVVSLVYEMIRSGNSLGLASLCIGGGMGTALILKRDDKF